MRKAKKILSGVLVLTLMLTMLPVAAKADSTSNSAEPISIAEGDPVSITWNGHSGQVANVDSSSNIIPANFTLWVEGTNVSVTRAVGNGTATAVTSNGSKIITEPSDSDEEGTVICTQNAFTIETDDNSSITVNVTIGTSAYGNEGSYSFTCPKRRLPSGGTYPANVQGYLPVGQFARPNSFGWGGICSDGTNTGSEYKFTNGYVSTGVSLGMAGGYVQFDMGDDNAITNDPKNPYGIDFVIYGNAFAGNPEAGSVMVSQNGTTWYELAGSRYYNADTQRNVNVSYINIGTAGKTISSGSYSSTFTKKGVYYSKDYAPSNSYSATQANEAIAKATWYCIPTSATVNSPVPSNSSSASTVGQTYWPELTATGEMYQGVWNIGNAVNNVYYNTNGDAQVITYKGITIVPDSDTNSYYQFGYFDTHVNGSNYGTAVNPYIIANDGTGGDGFDLSWAVKPNGEPIYLQSVKYVRVYSSVLFNAGVFGETSAELCGLYLTSNQIASGAGTTDFADVSSTVGSLDEEELRTSVLELATITLSETVDSTNLTFESSESNLYVNDAKIDSETTITVNRTNGNVQYFRVITQSDSAQAAVKIVKVVFQ